MITNRAAKDIGKSAFFTCHRERKEGLCIKNVQETNVEFDDKVFRGLKFFPKKKQMGSYRNYIILIFLFALGIVDPSKHSRFRFQFCKAGNSAEY